MSFNLEVKEEMAHIEPVCAECNRSLLAALIRIEGTLFISKKNNYRLEVVTDAPYIARLVWKLFHENYGLTTELTTRRSVLHKTPNFLINIPAQPNLKAALNDMGVLNNESLQRGIADCLVEKECCGASYLRGAFLGSGFISDPRGDFHFEISVESKDIADGLISILQKKEIKARMTKRRSSYVIYLKKADYIIEFLAYVGAHQSALAMENARVVKSVRNDVNRQINAEIANQHKTSSAAVDQIYAMRQVVKKYGADKLPPALREIIKLRANNPDASLKELGELANPPLSKSAVYHRIRRIEQMAKNID